MFTTAQMMVLDLVALIQALVSLGADYRCYRCTSTPSIYERSSYFSNHSMTVITGITLNIAISYNDWYVLNNDVTGHNVN